MARLRDSGQRRFWRWLKRRIPPARQVTLNQKNLFIFISRQGGGFLLLCVLVWIGATNFQNNLVLALCFLLLAILFIAIHLTFANLSGLTLRFAGAEPVFAGKGAACAIELTSATDRQQLLFGWPGEASTVASVLARIPAIVQLPLTAPRRGWYRPGRFRLQSQFPLGIIRCWTWLDLGVEVLVYPTPIGNSEHRLAGGAADEHGEPVAGSEDFHALRPYADGDTLARVAWKHYAAGRGLLVREQVDYRSMEQTLDFQTLHDADPEVRLGKLCFSALELSAEGRPFGLRLPQRAIPPATGDAHLQQVLQALAECPV